MKLLLRGGRSLLAILGGLFLISFIVETIEFSLVTLISDAPVTIDDPGAYYAIRNQIWFLVLKMGYNTLIAILGGYVCAWIAQEGKWHAVALAIVQTMGFLYAFFTPELGPLAPPWMWISLMLLSFPAIIAGARIWSIRQIPSPERPEE